jgi:hypothetical protein
VIVIPAKTQQTIDRIDSTLRKYDKNDRLCPTDPL